VTWVDGVLGTHKVAGVTNQLVGVAEVAKLLGVTRQRVNQLVQSEPDFPEPEATLAAGRIWRREPIEKWAEAHPRRRDSPRQADIPPT
jgi:prophage regulatory protein